MLYMATDSVAGKKVLQNVDMIHPHLIIKWKIIFPPRLFGKSFQEIEDRGTPLDELNMKFNIHVTGSVILTDLWYFTVRTYQKKF